MDSTDVFVPQDHVAYRTIGDEAVLVDTRSSLLLSLNETGTVVWNNLDGKTVDQIVQIVAETFAASRETVMADVVAFLSDLRDRGLIAAQP